MHTTVSELMIVFERIIEYGCKYCCVCLRMENEKNLIVPKAFKAYISTLNNKNIDFTETTRVCIICEEKAKAALRFLKAAQLAVSIQELYTDMLKEKSYRKEVQQHFNEINVKDHFRALDQVEEQLKSWRAHTELVFTEVLIVENVETSVDNSVSSEKIFSTEQKSKKLLTDETEEKVLDVSEESECSKAAGDDTVIVLDDDEVVEMNSNNDHIDDPSVSIYRCLKESRKRCKRTYTRSKININGSKLRIRNDLTDSTTIHPTNDTDGGPLLIDNPQLVQMLNNKKNHKDLNAISKVSLMKLDNATSLNINNMYQTVPDIFIQPTVCNSSGDLSFHDVVNPTDLNKASSLSAPQLLIIPNSIVNIPHNRSVWPVRVTAGLPVKQDSSTQLAEITPLTDKKTPSIAPTGEARKCLTIQSGKFQGVEKDLVKEPVPKAVKIDWEDKIPMDVISFMESNNQPVPASQIVSDSSPVGGITDVRSITDIMQDSNVPPIVDLCYLD